MSGAEFERTDGLFSLCELNCGLCPMQIRGECSGCFNGSTCYQTCPLAPCSVRHGNVQYCFQCPEYPCKRYEGIDAYLAGQRKKKTVLDRMLEEYDDGFHDVFFCLAANMLDANDLEKIICQADAVCGDMSRKEKAGWLKRQLHLCAEERWIPLFLRG